jgi:predicted kinase
MSGEPHQNPKLFIMCGLPFSGKSFAGREIAKLVNGVFISYDQLWVELDTNGEKNPSWERLSELAYKKIRGSLENSISIVYDTLNDVVSQRGKLRKIAKAVGCEAITLYMNTPVEVINQRRLQNESTKERHPVTDETLKEYIGRFESPIGEQNVIEVLPNNDLSILLSTNNISRAI